MRRAVFVVHYFDISGKTRIKTVARLVALNEGNSHVCPYVCR